MQLRFGNIILLLVFVFAIALGGAYLGLQLFGDGSSGGSSNNAPKLITVEVIVTATPDPNMTPNLVVITATLRPDQVTLPTELFTPSAAGSNVAGSTVVAGVSTVDPSITGSDAGLAQTAAALPAGCTLYTMVSGDSPYGIALEYGANPFDLMAVNGLDDDAATQLQIGDTLIIPLEGCPVADLAGVASIAPEVVEDETTEAGEETQEADAESTEALDSNATRAPNARPTLTLEPIARNAQIEIVEVVSAGDITAEGIKIRNSGNTVEISGWVLSDADGNEFVFPEQRLFSQAMVTVFSRVGNNTPVVLFWGLDEAVWQKGDVLTLKNKAGEVQATLRIP